MRSGPKLLDQRQGGLKTLRGLQRQPTDQIHVDALELRLAHPGHDPPQLIRRHDPIDGPLNFGVGVLDSEADAIEAELPQRQHLVAVKEFGIDFNRGLQACAEIKMGLDQSPENGLLIGGEVIRGASAPVELGEAPPLA
jgi:hypothetical protein